MPEIRFDVKSIVKWLITRSGNVAHLFNQRFLAVLSIILILSVEHNYMDLPLKKFYSLLSVLLFGYFLWLPVSAQIPYSTTEQKNSSSTPLNLDSDEVVKEIGNEQHSVETKQDVLSTMHNVFEQSILNSENKKNISGILEAGAGVEKMPAYRGFKTENVLCENTSVAINDEFSKTTQIGIYAQVNSCKVK